MTTIRGIQRGRLVWQPDFQAELSSEGKWTGSVSFISHSEDAVSLMPAKGASCPEVGFSFMGLDSVSVTTLEGGLKQVTCKYAAGGETGDFGFDDPSTTGRTELAISVSEEPLETCPRYAEVSEEDLYKIQDLKSGRFKVVPPETEGGTVKYVARVDGDGVKEVSFSDDRAAELASKITKGFTTYLQANQIYRVTVVSNNEVSAAKLNKVGKITSAPGAPEVGGGRTWLFVGVSSTTEGNSFTHTYEWRLSDVGGWDPEIYSGEEEE